MKTILSNWTKVAALLAVAFTFYSNEAWSQDELRSDRVVKKHREQTQAMTEPVYRRLGAIHTLMGEGDYTKALSDLNKLSNASLNNHEKALVQQTLGFVYVQQNRNRQALESFENALSQNALPGDVVQGLRYSLAGLYAAEGQFLESIKTMRLWFEYEAEPKAEAYMVIASSFAELDRYDDALPYVRKAIQVSKTPVESWYMLELAIHLEKDRYRDATSVLRKMLQVWPSKPRYWEMLSSIYLQLGEDNKALDSMMVAYENGLITDEAKIIAVVQLNLLQKIPLAAGNILSRAIANGQVEKNKKNLDLLLQAWTDAREFDKAISVIDELAVLSNDGNYYFRKAIISNELGDWDGVVKAVEQGQQLGVDSPGKALMLKGSALVELGRFREALAEFGKVKELGDSKERSNANEWIAFVSEKVQLKAALAE